MEESKCRTDSQKRDKQCVKTTDLSLFPQSVAKFQNVIFITRCSQCLLKTNLISKNQSGFTSGDSCVNQLLAITHENLSRFDDSYEVRGVFSNVFDKLWHEGIIHKLNRNAISGNLLSLLRDFLRYRKQRLVLKGQSSSLAISMLMFPKFLYQVRFYS